jgi:ribosomal protein S18 acetylase RimI-like enzyme
VDVRNAEETEVGRLARIWYDAWQDAHAAILPAELARLRTLRSFEDRLREALPHVRAAGPVDAPVAFCIVKEDQLYQLYVTAEARGSGIAAALVADAEERLVRSGVDKAWLSCAIGNERAARFYEKCGWQRKGVVTDILETTAGTFPLDVWRYEKSLVAGQQA